MKKNMLILIGVVFTCTLLELQTAQATIISYDATNISGNTWEYSYTLENNNLAAGIDEFTIYFDVGLYENLNLAVAPTDWDPLVIQPDTILPDDGFYDALAFGSGIALGDTLGGFSVRFDYLGPGAPGSQYFEVVDFISFMVIDQGDTQLAGVIPVPEPGTLWLMMTALLALAGLRIRRRQSTSLLQTF